MRGIDSEGKGIRGKEGGEEVRGGSEGKGSLSDLVSYELCKRIRCYIPILYFFIYLLHILILF